MKKRNNTVYITVSFNLDDRTQRIAYNKMRQWIEYLASERSDISWTVNSAIRELLFNLNSNMFGDEIVLSQDLDIVNSISNLKDMMQWTLSEISAIAENIKSDLSDMKSTIRVALLGGNSHPIPKNAQPLNVERTMYRSSSVTTATYDEED